MNEHNLADEIVRLRKEVRAKSYWADMLVAALNRLPHDPCWCVDSAEPDNPKAVQALCNRCGRVNLISPEGGVAVFDINDDEVAK